MTVGITGGHLRWLPIRRIVEGVEPAEFAIIAVKAVIIAEKTGELGGWHQTGADQVTGDAPQCHGHYGLPRVRDEIHLARLAATVLAAAVLPTLPMLSH